MNGLYRTIIRKAISIAWRYKYLWFFGLFASFAANGEEYDILVRNFNTVEQMQANLERLSRLKDEGQLAIGWQNITAYIAENLFSVLLIAAVILAILFLIVWLITVSQASIIAAASRHEKRKEVDFLDLFWSGHRYFWRIFLVNVYVKLILYGILLLPGIPLATLFVNTNELGYAVSLSLLAFFVLVPLSMIFSFITKYAAAFVVIEDYTANQAFLAAWRLFFKNWLVSLEMALLLFLINFGVTFLALALLGFSGLPFTQVGFIFFTMLVAFVGSVISTFQFSAWAILFIRLLEGKGFAKLTRVFASHGWLPPATGKKASV